MKIKEDKIMKSSLNQSSLNKSLTINNYKTIIQASKLYKKYFIENLLN